MTRTALPGKLIIYNGIVHQSDEQDQNLSFLTSTDIVYNEHFCLNIEQRLPQSQVEMVNGIDTELSVAARNPSKIVSEKTNYDPTLTDAQAINKLGRYCYGVFLLGYTPGHAYYKFGSGYLVALNTSVVNELNAHAQEMDVPLGDPVKKYSPLTSTVYQRQFSNGYVYVNMDGTNAHTITIPETLISENGGVPGQTYQQGQTVSVPSNDALFLLKTISTTLTPTPSPIPGDLDGNHHVNSSDWTLLKNNFGKTGINIVGDIDHNGKVDIFDYNTLVENFGK